MVTVAAVEKVLGGLGKPPRGANRDLALARAVRDGLPYAALERLIADGIVDDREVETYSSRAGPCMPAATRRRCLGSRAIS